MINNESLRDHLFRLEKRLLEPEIRHSHDELTALLADDFIEIGGSGQLYDRQAIIKELSEENTLKIAISDFSLRVLAEDIALVTYRAGICMESDASVKYSLRSSIWRQNRGQWRMIFHQGTPIAR